MPGRVRRPMIESIRPWRSGVWQPARRYPMLGVDIEGALLDVLEIAVA